MPRDADASARIRVVEFLMAKEPLTNGQAKELLAEEWNRALQANAPGPDPIVDELANSKVKSISWAGSTRKGKAEPLRVAPIRDLARPSRQRAARAAVLGDRFPKPHLDSGAEPPLHFSMPEDWNR